MSRLVKFLILALLLINLSNISYAFSKKKLNNYIKESYLNDTSTISISVRNVKNNKIVYAYNDKKLLIPASTLKIFTQYSAMNYLGYDYEFSTKFYKDKNNNLYIKTGADPLLKTYQLQKGLKTLKHKKFNNIYLDDSIIDRNDVIESWMIEDEKSPCTPRVSSYNLDSNTITHNSKLYPVKDMKKYYIGSLNKIFAEEDITFNRKDFTNKKVPVGSIMLFEVKNPIAPALEHILQNSSNYMAETLFKLSANKKYALSGTLNNAIEQFREFYSELGLNMDNITIHDASGVSRNNILYTDWMSEALVKIYNSENFNQFKNYMAYPTVGTMSERLSDLKGNGYFKTGTLSNVSGLIGYINSKDKNTYAVSVLIQNHNQKTSLIKQFENEIMRIIFNK